MAANPKVLSLVLGITLRAITGWVRKKARGLGETGPLNAGAVTLIQRFGGSVNLNLHFHMLVLDGVYVGQETPSFTQLPPPNDEEVLKLIKTLATRILRCLTRRGYFEASPDSGDLESDSFAEAESVLASCMAASIKYRIALGERAGQRVRRLGTMEECFYEEAKLEGSRCASLRGFSLHANTACEAWERDKLERLCRYVARPAIAMGRLSKRPYQDGTQYLLFSRPP